MKRATRVPASSTVKNEQRFKPDGKVIPERHHGGATQTVRKDLRHSQRESRSAAGAEK